MLDTTTRQLWQDTQSKRRMIAVGVAVNGGAFAVIDENERIDMYAETKRNVALLISPHYTDSRFKKEQTVFGKPHDELHYDYSDRLVQWDRDKSKAAFEAAKQSGKVLHSASFYDVYLTEYFGKPTIVEHIISGVNVSDGYPYNVFGYRFIEK